MSVLIYSVTGVVIESGEPTMVCLHTNSPRTALTLLKSDHSMVVVVDDCGRPVSKAELARAACKRGAGYGGRTLH